MGDLTERYQQLLAERAAYNARVKEFAEILNATVIVVEDEDEPLMWTFLTGNGAERTFGPYRTVTEAQDAFQWKHGYWPDAPVRVTPYVPGADQ